MSDVDVILNREPPTATKKLSESYSRGQFAKAPEIGMTLTLLAGLVVILFYAPSKASEVMSFLRGLYLKTFIKSLLHKRVWQVLLNYRL